MLEPKLPKKSKFRDRMETGLREIFGEVERYVLPLIKSDPDVRFSKEENRILALQQINRLNQRIGQLARSSKDKMPDMKVLQTQVNNMTIGIKSDNTIQVKNALTQVKSLIATIDSKTD